MSLPCVPRPAADMRGNLAAFTVKGEELWERHVQSAVSQVPPASPLAAALRRLHPHCVPAPHRLGPRTPARCSQ